MNPTFQNGQPASPSPHANAIKTNVRVSAALLALLLICYANSFQAAWQYDDYPNIVENPKIRMTDLSWEQIEKGLSAGLSYQTVSRPLAYLSFALNYRWGGYKVVGYHIVNFSIHWLAAIFLFLFIQRLLRLPIFQGRYESKSTVVAGLSAAFWATHPIQVTAVTYIVQRMTSMAGLFYVASLYFYLVGRTSVQDRARFPALFGCAVCAIAGMMTKENSVLLIYALFLLDRLFLQPADKHHRMRTLIWFVGLSAGIGLLGALYTNPLGLLQTFTNRPFSMAQRLLSQPRMLFDYLGILAVPLTSHLSLLHDVQVSRSLFIPWTTLPAIIGLLAFIIFLWWLIPRQPLYAFCGIFFFLNHLVESSFLNLELYYEHRNYIPSMLLFVPLAMAAVKSIRYFRYRRSFQYMIGGTLIFLLAGNMQTTWAYNRYMQSELSLWSHVKARYPKASLAHSNLGKIYWSLGLYEESCQELKRAVELDRFNEQHQKGLAYYNLGLCEAYKEHNYSLAIMHLQTARTLYKDYPKILFEIARCRIQIGDWSSADAILGKGLARWPGNSDLLSLAAILDLKRGNFQKAVQVARKLVHDHSGDQMGWLILAQGYRLMGDIRRALESLESLRVKHPDNILCVMALIEINVNHREFDKACEYFGQYLKLKKYRASLEAIEFSRLNRAILPYTPDQAALKKLNAVGCIPEWESR